MSGGSKGRTERHADRPGSNLSKGTCPRCGKVSFPTRAAAKRRMRQIKGRDARMRAYRCGDVFHLTSQDAETTTRYRDEAAQPAADDADDDPDEGGNAYGAVYPRCATAVSGGTDTSRDHGIARSGGWGLRGSNPEPTD